MKTAGIIAEFNPFHKGHAYLVSKTREITGAECIVSVMSGNFMQRGLPAVYDKWERTEMALKEGVDLIVELPVIYSSNSAEFFAAGGVTILEGMGCIDYLVFGSESGDIELMEKAAGILKEREEDILTAIKAEIKKGVSFPKARETALSELGLTDASELLKEPNNILGMEYLKHNSDLKAYTVKRKGQGHHESASVIREELKKTDGERISAMEERYYNLLRERILSMSEQELDNIFSAGSGLGSRLKKEVRYAESLENFTDRIKSKAYTRTRITRLFTHVLLNITEDVMNEGREYIRVLGFNDRGAEILKKMKKEELNTIPVITNLNKELFLYEDIKKTVEKDILATDLYNLISGKDLYRNSDYVRKPVILKYSYLDFNSSTVYNFNVNIILNIGGTE